MNMPRRVLSVGAMGLCALALPAWSGINISGLSTYAEGGAIVNADTQGLPNTQAVNGSDSIQALRFDFTAGGSATMNLPLTALKQGAHVMLSVRAPLDNKLSLQIIGSDDEVVPCTPTASLCQIDRSAASLDDLGWSRHSLAFTLPTDVTVKALKLLIDGTPQNQGVAYVRSVQIRPYAPSLADPVTPWPSINFSTVTATPVSPATASILPPEPVYSGNAFQILKFGFSGLNQMVSLNMPLLDQTLPNRLDTSYVRFKMNLPAGHPVYLRVVDKDGEVFPFSVNRLQTTPDIQGWTTHLVKLYSHGGAWGGNPANKTINLPLKEVRLVVNSASSTAVNDRAYFKDIDLLDHAPSPFETLVAAPYLATNEITAPPHSAVPAGQDATRSFSFTPSSGLTSAGMSIGIPDAARPVAGQTLRFLAKVPRGYNLNVHFNDAQEHTFDARAIRPLAVVDDAGWVEYAVKLESTSATDIVGPIRRFRFVVSANAMNGIVAARDDSQVQALPVTTQIKSLYIDEFGRADHPLDLLAGTPVSADWRAVHAQPLLNTGVAAAPIDAGEASSIGFRKVRFDLYWESSEKTKDHYDFTRYLTPLQAMFAITPRVDPVIVLAYNNKLHSPTGTPNSKDQILDNSDNQVAFLKYVNAAVTAVAAVPGADPSRITFEIWNEQNADPFWVPSDLSAPVAEKATHYAQLLIKATALIKGIDGRFKVMSGGLAQPTDQSQFDTTYLKVLHNNTNNAFSPIGSPTGPKVDLFGFHPYQHTIPELKAVEQAGVEAYFRQAGLTTPWAVSEVGTSSRMPLPDGSTPENRQKQARVQLRNVLTSWAMNRPMHILFSLRDNPAAVKIEEQHYGLLDKNGLDKPAGSAIKHLFSLVNGRKLDGVVTGSPSRVQAMKFSAEGQDTVYVAWSNSSTPGEASAITTLSTASVTDMGGLPVNCPAIGGGTRIRCPITEENGPIFIRVARP